MERHQPLPIGKLHLEVGIHLKSRYSESVNLPSIGTEDWVQCCCFIAARPCNVDLAVCIVLLHDSASLKIKESKRAPQPILAGLAGQNIPPRRRADAISVREPRKEKGRQF